jgi:uncharacterized membrane protein
MDSGSLHLRGQTGSNLSRPPNLVGIKLIHLIRVFIREGLLIFSCLGVVFLFKFTPKDTGFPVDVVFYSFQLVLSNDFRQEHTD